MAIIDDVLAQNKERADSSNWVKDLIDKRYQPQEERIKRTPVGFQFKRDPFDPSSYYTQLNSLNNMSRAATGVTLLTAQNKKNAEAQRAWEEAQNALNGVNPNFTYGGGGTPNSGSSRNYGLKNVSKNTGAAADYWGSKYGISTVGGWREHGSVPGSDHPKGRALDFMINDIKNGKATGTALANDIIKNYKAWNVSYVIWNRYIWSPSKGWRKYNGPSPHTDHVHVSFNK